jgi:hypothetical protein
MACARHHPHRNRHSGRERLTLNVLGPDLFEIALLDGSPHGECCCGAGLRTLYSRRLISAFIEEPRIAIRLIELLCQRLRWMNERMEEWRRFLRADGATACRSRSISNGTAPHQGELSEFVGGA